MDKKLADMRSVAIDGDDGSLESQKQLAYLRAVAGEAHRRAWPTLASFANTSDERDDLRGWKVYAQIPNVTLRDLLHDLARDSASTTIKRSFDAVRGGNRTDDERSAALGIQRDSFVRSWRRPYEWTYQRGWQLLMRAELPVSFDASLRARSSVQGWSAAAVGE